MYTGEKTSNQYFVCQKHLSEPICFNLDNLESVPTPECIYFGRAFQEMEKSLKASNLTVFLTDNLHSLPVYGHNVVVVLYADEWCRFPSYAHKVLAVFKVYGTKLILGCNPLLRPSRLNLLTLVQFIKTHLIRSSSWIKYRLNYLKQYLNGCKLAVNIFEVPLGYYRQLDLPIKDIETRSFNVFFGGSITHREYKSLDPRYLVSTPKTVSRQLMLSYLDELKIANQDLKIEYYVTPRFVPGYTENTGAEMKIYSEKMMDSKICLAPRGTSFETYRFFESMRYGCVVITEALPPYWFYAGSPAIQIEDWSKLGGILESLIKDKDTLKEIHQQSLEWWQSKCSESALGTYMAETLNTLLAS